jgi:2,4-dienoyl-CoA reductase-like NADH-dependent reductase (Old Yellow Enzyme family)
VSLFDPLVFPSGLAVRNRAFLAPLTNKQSHSDGSLGDDELRWLCSRAAGGFGLVETCAAHVSRDGQNWPGQLGIFDDALLPGLTRLADEIRRRGPASILQLFHGGGRADPTYTGVTPWGPSEADGIRAATGDDLARVVKAFADAAVRAQTAGCDGVEVHAGHGYLFTAFLSATANQRADAWGGPLENRARLVRDTVRAIRGRVGRTFTVGVRLSPEDWGRVKGLDLDESLQVAQWLCEDGVDFVHLSLWQALAKSAKYPGTHPLPLFRRAVASRVPILAAGSIWTLDEAEAVLALGADAVAVGRAAIANPDWARRAADPHWAPRRPPVTIEELRASGLNRTFAEYMRSFAGFVAD